MPDSILARLEHDGLLHRAGDTYRTTRRWQGAMARAAFRLLDAEDEGHDLRFPIASALVELYPGASAEEIVAMVRELLAIEARELDPRPFAGRKDA